MGEQPETVPAVSRRGFLAVASLLAALVVVACAARRVPPPGPRSAPRPVRSQLGQADELLRTGRDDEALAAYTDAVDADPDSVPAHLRYVSALSALGRRSEARRVYRQRVARPCATEADRIMAARLETDGSSSALRRVYALASEREPDSPWWRLATAEVELAEAAAWNRRRVEAVERSDRDEEKRAMAQARGALARAGRALERAQASGPSLAEVDLYRGHLRAVEGDLLAGAVARAAAYRAAEVAFARAAMRDPELVGAWEGLGEMRLETGDTKGSLLAYLEAAERSPADPRYREAVGVVLHRVERYAEAAEQFREAARLAPRDPMPWERLGDAYVGDEKWDLALDAYTEALERDAGVVEAHYRRATILEHVGRLGEARAEYELYLSQGGDRESTVRRRVERLLRSEELKR